jgi:hypothetical protein
LDQDAVKLVEATLMFKRVASAPDDIAALDELKLSALSFKKRGLFASTLDASQYLASVQVFDMAAEPMIMQALEKAGLSVEDVHAAQLCATRFVGTVGA